MPDSVFPFAVVAGLVFVAVVLALVVSLAVEQLAFVPAAVGPFVNALAGDGVVDEWAFVLEAAGPDELAFAMHEAVLKGALEYVSIGEYDLAVAVEALEISVGSGLDLNLAVPPSVVFGGKFKRQEGGM